MSDDIKAMKLKISKLLAMAQGSSNENEAMAFMEKAEQLMEDWQLSEWECSSVDDPMGVDVMLEGTSSSPSWQRHLVSAVGRYYGCSPVRRRGLWKNDSADNFEIDLIGRESSRVTAQIMYPFILKQLREAGRRLHSEGHRGSRDALTRRVANALVMRIYSLIAQRERETVTTRHDAMRNERALVVVNEIKSYIEDKYGALKQSVGRSVSTTEAARKAAAGIAIERQVKGTGQLRLT